jgi:hypothetical protein
MAFRKAFHGGKCVGDQVGSSIDGMEKNNFLWTRQEVGFFVESEINTDLRCKALEGPAEQGNRFSPYHIFI